MPTLSLVRASGSTGSPSSSVCGVGQLQHLLCGRHFRSDGSVVRRGVVKTGSGVCYLLGIFALLREEYLEYFAILDIPLQDSLLLFLKYNYKVAIASTLIKYFSTMSRN